MLCADMVEVCWKDGTGKPRRAMALLEDIAPSGACLQLETAIPRGTKLRWKCPKQEFAGRVCYCVFREIGYFLGVRFDAARPWSQKAYKPQHLLDLQCLVARARK